MKLQSLLSARSHTPSVNRPLATAVSNAGMNATWASSDRAWSPWDDQPLPLEQHPGCARALQADGYVTSRYLLGDARAPDAAATIVLRPWRPLGTFAVVVRGPAFRHPVAPEDRIRAVRQLADCLAETHGGVQFTPDRIGDSDPLDGHGWLRSVTPASLARLSLAPSETELRKALHGKWRNRLVRAEDTPLKVKDAPFPPDPEHWLIQEELRQRKAKRYAAKPADFAATWVRVLGKRSARLFLAEHEMKPVAAMLFLLHGTTATYQIGWSDDAGRAMSAHNLLMWRAILWLKAAGVRWLELDGIDTVASPGLARLSLEPGHRWSCSGQRA